MVSAPSCFIYYSGGVLSESSCACAKYENGGPLLEHSLTIVGYSSSKAVAGCNGWWIAQNSKGTNWGLSGFINICIPATPVAQQYGTCHI